VVAACPDLPYGPQLGAVMLAEACRPLSGVDARPDGSGLVARAPISVHDVEPLPAFERVLDATDGAVAVKTQLCGPATLAGQLAIAGVDAMRAGALALDATRRSLAAVTAARRDRALVVFLDEPGVGRGGDDAGSVRASVEFARAGGATVGVHPCRGGRVDLAVASGADVVGVVVDDAGEWVPALAAHVGRGGWIAWGLPDVDARTAMSAVERAAQSVGDLDDVCARSIVTPECGLAGSDAAAVVRVFATCRAVGARIAERAGGAAQ